jgi:iron(II)-dependent oxidoreductase
MSFAETVSQAPAHTATLVEELEAARAQTLALVACLGDAQLDRAFSPLMSPLIWDLGHIAAYEDLWLGQRHAGVPLLRADLAERYDAFETPRAARVELDYLRGDDCRAYMTAVRDRVRRIALRDGVGEGLLHELVIRHERQHNETMLQTLNLARLSDWRAPNSSAEPVAAPGATPPSGLDLVAVPAGEFVLGAGEGGFAFDNERPAQTAELPAFSIGRTAVTNGDWLEFVRDGGYERRDWWSDEGWAWLAQEGVRQPLNWLGDARSSTPREWRLQLSGAEELHLARPVVHISWYEADAFARARGVRLPTELEWEKAATWDWDADADADRKRPYPWGAQAPALEHANLIERGLWGAAAADAHIAGAAPCGALGMIGDVWEWTASPFEGYPGFRAHPYREYSEVFFGDGHRVLRGGSWATSARVATPTFRNWDYPQRRQIFAGLRVARDG